MSQEDSVKNHNNKCYKTSANLALSEYNEENNIKRNRKCHSSFTYIYLVFCLFIVYSDWECWGCSHFKSYISCFYQPSSWMLCCCIDLFLRWTLPDSVNLTVKMLCSTILGIFPSFVVDVAVAAVVIITLYPFFNHTCATVLCMLCCIVVGVEHHQLLPTMCKTVITHNSE